MYFQKDQMEKKYISLKSNLTNFSRTKSYLSKKEKEKGMILFPSLVNIVASGNFG